MVIWDEMPTDLSIFLRNADSRFGKPYPSILRIRTDRPINVCRPMPATR